MALSDKEKYLKNVIKEWHFKSPNKVIKHLKGNELGITSKDVYQFFDKYHLKKSIKKFDKSLMGNKFSSIKDAYQMDIYFIGKEYIYLLLININTKYAWCKRMPNKKADSVVEALKDFVPQYHPKIIESDEDSAFLDIKTMNYLQSENIILKTTPRKYKDYLSVIDRLCTTLNKYVYEGTGLNVEASKDESKDEDMSASMFKIDDDAEYADQFEVPSDYDENEAINTDVESFIDKYNKTYNYAIKMTPEQMQKDENEQLKWVYHQLKIRDAKDKMNLSRNLKVGDKVRYILDRDRGKKKHAKGIKKHQFSKYYYIINRVITPYLYEIIAKDGTVKAVPRYRLYKLNYIGDVKWSKSIYNEGLEEDALGKPIYFIDKILEYEYTDKSPQIKKCFYTVRKVQIRDKQRPLIVKEKMSVYQFRQRFNIITSLNKLEMEFLDNHPDDWKYDSKKKLIVPK